MTNKVQRAAAPAVTCFGSNGTAPNPSLKRISTSSNSNINVTSGSARHLEKLTEETESCVLPEGSVDDVDYDSDTHSEVDNADLKITQTKTKILTNGSSSEDLLETEDNSENSQSSEEEEQLEKNNDEAVAPVVASKGPNFEERLKLAQPIWYLPHINRATVVHYLQGKSVGVFIVSYFYQTIETFKIETVLL